MFKIGDFSILSHVSVRMLRYYDETGLLKPAKVDKFTNYRFYSSSQILRLNKIVALRDMGFIVSEIAEILDEKNDTVLLEKLKVKKNEIQNSIFLQNQKLTRIENIIKYIGLESVNMNYEVNTTSIPAQKVVSIRDIIPTYTYEGNLWDKLHKFIEKENVAVSKKELSFSIYYDNGYKDNDVDIEIAMPVEELGKSKDNFVFKQIDGVELAASTMMSGPYENIPEAYTYLARWIEEHGEYEMYDHAREIYHRGHWNENDVQNYLTEIVIPIRKVNR